MGPAPQISRRKSQQKRRNNTIFDILPLQREDRI